MASESKTVQITVPGDEKLTLPLFIRGGAFLGLVVALSGCGGTEEQEVRAKTVTVVETVAAEPPPPNTATVDETTPAEPATRSVTIRDLDGAPLGRLTFDDVYRTSQIGDARGDLLVIEATFTNDSDDSLRLNDLIEVGTDVRPCTTGVCRSGDFEIKEFGYYNGGGWLSPTSGGSYSLNEDQILGGDTVSFSYFLNMNPGSIRPNPDVTSTADLWLVLRYSSGPIFPRSVAVRLSEVLGTEGLHTR